MCVDIIERPNLAEILLWGIHIIFLQLPVASCTACDVRCVVWLICWTLRAATFDWQKRLWRQPVCTCQGPCSCFWWITLAHANIKCCVNARLHGCIWIKPKPHVQDDDRFAKKVRRRSWTPMSGYLMLMKHDETMGIGILPYVMSQKLDP